MRVARLERGQTTGFFLLDGDGARPLPSEPYGLGKSLRAAAGAPTSFDASELRAPVVPTKIVCVGRNYAAHAKELGNEVPSEPLLFVKPPSSVVGPGSNVIVPPESARVEHEAELGVVVGRRLRRATRDEARTAIFGYTCVCDVTARDLQKKDGQWSRAKGFDTFCPVGPWIETELDASDVRVRCEVDGATRQDGRTSQMVFDVPTLVAYVSQAMTLEPGDLIVTGTPEGVGPLSDGNRVLVAIDGIGDLVFGVRAESRSAG